MGRSVPPSRSDQAAACRITQDDMPAPEVGARPLVLRPGTVVPRGQPFEIVELLGEGGMGKVYRAYDAVLERYVAIKVLKPTVPEVQRKRFFREARLAASFSHPNLVRVLDAGSLPGGAPYMVLEYLRGRDLGKVLEDSGRLGPDLVVEIFTQVLDALAYVHERSIVHCDVKPENLFLTRDPFDRRIFVVKLLDFGIHRDLRPPLELWDKISGDPRYMAPEQGRPNGPVDPRTDLYAVGMAVYEAATGLHPFRDLFADGPLALLSAHAERAPDPPSRHLPGGLGRPFAEALDAFFARACAKDKTARYASALEAKRALLRLGEIARLRAAG